MANHRATRALEALNFFMADIQAGIGPFLGVFLQAHGWSTGAIGSVMTAGGVAGMAMAAPAGALIDASRRKRAIVVVTGVCTVLASFLILRSQSAWVVAISQIGTAIAGAAIIPAVAGITLGIVGQRSFNRQNGRNQAFNHAGNMAGAAFSGYLGWRLGMPAVFWLAAFFGFAAIVSVLLFRRHPLTTMRRAALKQLLKTAEIAKPRGSACWQKTNRCSFLRLP